MPAHPQERQKTLNWANFLVTSCTSDIDSTKMSSILIIVRTGLLGVKNLGRTAGWAGKLLRTEKQPHAYGHEVQMDTCRQKGPFPESSMLHTVHLACLLPCTTRGPEV